MLLVQKIVCNFQKDVTGIQKDSSFSWSLKSDKRGVLQTAYRLQVSRSSDFSKPLYDTGKKESEDSVAVPLSSFVFDDATQYSIRVMVWDNTGEESPWSEAITIETARKKKPWEALFITAEDDKDKSDARLLRKEFVLDEKLVSAKAYITALGLYEFYVNGKRVGEDLFTPGWTSYTKRLLYQSYDVRDFLTEGTNCLASMVGSGWYKGTIGFELNKHNYGEKSAFFCQLELETVSGKKITLNSDRSWKWHEGPISFSEFYDGETYDARLEIPGWNKPNFNESAWKPVTIVEHNYASLTPEEGVPTQVIEEIAAQKLITTPEGEIVIDFGQNLTGWVKFFVQGKAGEKVVLRHAEILDSKGNFYTKNLRSAKQTVRYTLKGDQQGEIYHPHFSFQGFRFIAVDAYPGSVELKNFTAQVIHSKMEKVGDFSCSNPLLNQLQHNILWGLKGNFLNVPTDCPQRDERLGWTGDAQMFVSTACYLKNTHAFFSKWLRDLEADQRENGAVSHVVPDVIKDGGAVEDVRTPPFGSSAWGDAATIVPWALYRYYGDVEVLRKQYSSMKRWVGFIQSEATDGFIWEKTFSFGDWVALDAKPGSYFGATPTGLVSTSFYALSTKILAKSAALLGKNEDAKKYTALYEKVKEAFNKKFMGKDKRPLSRTQTSCILPLVFDLLSDDQKGPTVDLLCALIDEHGGHLTTGFVGTPYICKALSDNGKLKEAYDLLLKQDYPSWLYQVTHGATTIWEHWDGLKPDGSLWSPNMNSFNHYAYGAVGEWLYTVVAGLNIDEEMPAFKHSIIHPRIGGGLSFAEASHQSPYGEVKSRWEVAGERVLFKVNIPVNTTATVILDDAQDVQSRENLPMARHDGIPTFEVGSGEYVFTYVLPLLKNT